jgi:hypothetical protein
MVRRSTLAVALVVVLASLSGCSAVLDGGNGDANGAGEGDPSTFDYADGYGPEGVTDGQAAVRSHQSGVVDRDSYTGSYTYTYDTDEGTTDIEVENRVDFEAEQGLQRADVTYPDQEAVVTTYHDSDTRYQRSEFDNQTSVNTANDSFDATNLTATDPVRPLLVNVSAYESSTAERNGDAVVVYETNGTDGVDAFLDVNESATITDFSATVAVDGDGVVRSASYDVSYEVDGEERDLTVEYELSGFGETSVERPAWVEDA